MIIAGARIAALILLFVICVPIHLATKLMFGWSDWPRRFLAASAWICGARVRITGKRIAPHTLLICNHTSWLDIPTLGGATGCAFVSKAELGHPLVHWMAEQDDTIYVRRNDRRGAGDQARAIAEKLRDPQPLALFPEGTTGPGTHLLPFRSTLFDAVAPAPPRVQVRPVAIDYGDAAPDFGWYEEPGKDNVLRILGRARSVPVTIRILDPLEPASDRKALAQTSREAIEAALASSRRSARL
ncbi:MAG TPA: 1-acyl-sn-glycerol-3-phosphate acyltransferase [Sphingomicrobium sp.]|jgi:1-acyl-sn-glycerol-3-phosphate acyltransferase|nr:1-acyl-sn-glycerol-3-phosphate acyltransferase [Sphingomicrobium sp.]